MIKVIFCPEGHHVADDHTLEYVDSVFWEYDFGGRMDIEVKVGNELIVDGFVLRVLEKKFPKDELKIFDNNVELFIDDCCGLIVVDERQKLTLGAQARITKAILDIACKNIETKRREGKT